MKGINLILLLILLIGTACSAEPEKTAAKKNPEDEFKVMRQEMIDRQIISRGVKDPLVLEALNSVKRHEFVPNEYIKEAYADNPLPIGEGQTISQPYIVALMTELAKIDKNSKVLEVGTGSGYQAAVLGEIAQSVYSIEIVPALGKHSAELLKKLGYENIHVKIGDGYKGWPDQAPFDAILVTAAPDHIPQPLVDQLKVGGRMVIPVGDYYQELEVITKNPDGKMERQQTIPVRFVPMTGEAQEKPD